MRNTDPLVHLREVLRNPRSEIITTIREANKVALSPFVESVRVKDLLTSRKGKQTPRS